MLGLMSTTVRNELLTDLTDLLEIICQTPAPTFEEGERGELVARLLLKAGLEPQKDSVGNITAEVPGGTGPRVLVAAHLDTVFARDTDVTVKRDGVRWRAPGIGDNSASLAVLVGYAQKIVLEDTPRPRLTLAASVGEEGLGDLYGVRELMKHRADELDMFIALDGHLGTIVDKSVGSKRFEISINAAGGHSWGDYPNPSATHALGAAIHTLVAMRIPDEPRSSLNVGQVSGGTSINAIAEDARFNLDLRSLDEGTLEGLEQEALKRIRRVVRQHDVQVDVRRVGDRPTASVDNAALVKAAKDALASEGVAARTAPSSTDANAAMAAGIPAISFGVYRGGDAHRLSEWLEPASLMTGYKAFVRLIENLSLQN